MATVASTIRSQISVGTFMSLGASELHARQGGHGFNPGLGFIARVLPFTKAGHRGSRARRMQVLIELTPQDDYTITVDYHRGAELVEHVRIEGVYADQLDSALLAIDYDGPEVLNPRLWPSPGTREEAMLRHPAGKGRHLTEV